MLIGKVITSFRDVEDCTYVGCIEVEGMVRLHKKLDDKEQQSKSKSLKRNKKDKKRIDMVWIIETSCSEYHICISCACNVDE